MRLKMLVLIKIYFLLPQKLFHFINLHDTVRNAETDSARKCQSRNKSAPKK